MLVEENQSSINMIWSTFLVSHQITSNLSFKVYDRIKRLDGSINGPDQNTLASKTMKAAVLLLFCSLFIFSQSDPDPELNLHIHLPPGEGSSFLVRVSACSNFLFSEGSPHIGRGSVTEGKNVLKIKILSWQQKVQKVQKKGDCKSTTTIQARRNQDQRKLRRGSPRPRWRTRWWRSRRTRRRTRRSASRWRGRWTTSPMSLAAPTTSLLVKIVLTVWVALMEPLPGA